VALTLKNRSDLKIPIVIYTKPTNEPSPRVDKAAEEARANYFGKLDRGLKWNMRDAGKAKEVVATVSDADLKDFHVEFNSDFFTTSWVKAPTDPTKVIIYVWPTYPKKGMFSQMTLVSGGHDVGIGLSNFPNER
jgi:hypothetical protein